MSLSLEVRHPFIRFPPFRPAGCFVFFTLSSLLSCSSLGRIWNLKFYVKKHDDTHQPGPWAVMIHTVEQSPPTHLDARIVIKEPEKEHPNLSPATPPPNGILASLLTSPSPSSSKSNPPIEFRLKTSTELTAVKTGRRPEHSQRVRAFFTDNAQGNSLQYS